MLTTLLLTALGGLVLTVVAKRFLSRSPSGPIGIPGFGLLPLFAWRASTNPRHRMYLQLQELRRNYGDILSYRLGTQEFILISGSKTLHDVFVTNGDKFLGRANTNFHTFVRKRLGIVGSEGAVWQEHRRFALRVLRDFGFGKNASETQIQEEASLVTSFLIKKGGQKVDTKDFLGKAVANVITRFLFSNFNSYDDPDFQEFIEKLECILNTDIVSTLTAFYRLLPIEAILAMSATCRKQFEANNWIEEFSLKKIVQIRSKWNMIDEPSNYVEAYLQEQHKRRSEMGTFTDLQLVRTICELYVAGTDTSSNTLRWCLLYAALNPELQDRCHAEIMAKIGKRQVTMKDKKELYYCLAFMDEAQRLSTLVPTSLDHRATQDTEFNGYHISSDAVILPNLYGLHHDEKIFPDPDSFDPNRFLTPDGVYKQSEFLSQFGIGKRSCLGEGLARIEVFLFFVTFMQHFRFETDRWTTEQQEQILLGTEGFIHSPANHYLIVCNRE